MRLAPLLACFAACVASACSRAAPAPPSAGAADGAAGERSAGEPPKTPPVWPGPGAPPAPVAATPPLSPVDPAADPGAGESVAEPFDGPVDPAVTLERTSCLGPCPAYVVEVHLDGRVIFKGWSYVATRQAEQKIDVSAVQALLDRASRDGFWDWKSTYLSHATDHPSAIVRVRTADGRTKTVKENPPCSSESGAPPALCALAAAIDAAAGTAKWTTCKGAGPGGRKDTCPQIPGSTARPPTSAGCNPPWFLDSSGVKHYKPECPFR